jgi:two-component system chemotaxis response regulator CheY
MKILIVDDSMTSRMLFKAFMPKGGLHQLIEAANFQEALVKMGEEKPELVVLDYNMPEHNGMEIAQMMQKSGGNSKYVLLTANTQKMLVNAAHEAGFIQVLEKPINAEKVAALLKQVA